MKLLLVETKVKPAVHWRSENRSATLTEFAGDALWLARGQAKRTKETLAYRRENQRGRVAS